MLDLSVKQGVPLRDVLMLPAMNSCVVAAGVAHLDRHVRWVHCSDLPDIAYWLRGGELLFHTGVQNTATSLLHLVRELHEADAAALAIALPVANLPADILALAENLGLPVISVPDEYRFVDITYEVGRLLVGADALISGRVEAFWGRVVDESLWAVSMGRLLAVIGDTVLSPPLAVYDRHRKLITSYAPEKAAWGAGEPPEVLRPGSADSLAIVAIEVTGGTNGYLAFPSDVRRTPGFDRLARHAARALGLAVDMSLRVDDLRARWKSDLFARILESSGSDSQEIELDARRAGLEIARKYRVVTLDARGTGLQSVHVIRGLSLHITKQLGIAPIFHALDEVGSLLVPASIEPEELVRAIRGAEEALAAEEPQVAMLRVGIGRSQAGLRGITEGAREADTAARTADEGEMAWYEALRVSRILVKGLGNRTLLDDTASRLRPLSGREREHLQVTIEALVETNFNASEAAKRLGLHRNGLRERIVRLSAKVGCDLRDVAEVTSMWLAMQAYREPDDGGVRTSES